MNNWKLYWLKLSQSSVWIFPTRKQEERKKFILTLTNSYTILYILFFDMKGNSWIMKIFRLSKEGSNSLFIESWIFLRIVPYEWKFKIFLFFSKTVLKAERFRIYNWETFQKHTLEKMFFSVRMSSGYNFQIRRKSFRLHE